MPSRPTTASPPRPIPRRLRVPLADGSRTTAHVLAIDRRAWTARVALLSPPRRLHEWCAETGAPLAMVGGFYVREWGVPLGELRSDGRRLASVPFHAPWGGVRACVAVNGDGVALRSRLELPAEPPGDLLQAGPMLVRDGVELVAAGGDPEGFSAGSEQFDSDITAGRHPRAALGVGDEALLAVVADGRAPGDAGLTLAELGRLMRRLGARDAINLDGGGSASLVCDGLLVNEPRELDGTPISGGREIVSALRFEPR